MSDDKLNEKANDNEFGKDAELITDSPSAPLNKVEKEGPKRRTKNSEKKVVEDIDLSNEELIEEITEEIIAEEESIEIVEEVVIIEEEIVEEVIEETVEIVEESKPKRKKKKSRNRRKKKVDNSVNEKHTKVQENEEAKIPKTMKQRYVDMLEGKNFEVRIKGTRLYDSSSKLKFELTETGVKINNSNYRYSEIVIRIK